MQHHMHYAAKALTAQRHMRGLTSLALNAYYSLLALIAYKSRALAIATCASVYTTGKHRLITTTTIARADQYPMRDASSTRCACCPI